jgi:hypothetical protein
MNDRLEAYPTKNDRLEAYPTGATQQNLARRKTLSLPFLIRFVD